MACANALGNSISVRAADEIYPPEGGGFNLTYGNKHRPFVFLGLPRALGSLQATGSSRLAGTMISEKRTSTDSLAIFF